MIQLALVGREEDIQRANTQYDTILAERRGQLEAQEATDAEEDTDAEDEDTASTPTFSAEAIYMIILIAILLIAYYYNM